MEFLTGMIIGGACGIIGAVIGALIGRSTKKQNFEKVEDAVNYLNEKGYRVNLLQKFNE